MAISELAKDIIDLIGINCEVIPAGTEIGDVFKLYNREAVNSMDAGFPYRPVFIIPSETLYETLLMNLNNDEEEIVRENIIKYNEKMKNSELVSGEEYFARKIKEREADISAFMGKPAKAIEYGFDNFESLCEDGTEETKEIIFARVPVTNPWEIFAYLPFGGWNECPDTLELMAVCKYWYEKYYVRPVVISSDMLEFNDIRINDEATALKVATEMYIFCNDIIEQGLGTINKLSKLLMTSVPWTFWWD